MGMTREEAIRIIRKMLACTDLSVRANLNADMVDACHLAIKALEQESKTGHCKDCKWWKDSDGKYRRGCGAESQCPINTHAVYCGEGYCYMFEPKKREDKE